MHPTPTKRAFDFTVPNVRALARLFNQLIETGHGDALIHLNHPPREEGDHDVLGGAVLINDGEGHKTLHLA